MNVSMQMQPRYYPIIFKYIRPAINFFAFSSIGVCLCLLADRHWMMHDVIEPASTHALIRWNLCFLTLFIPAVLITGLVFFIILRMFHAFGVLQNISLADMAAEHLGATLDHCYLAINFYAGICACLAVHYAFFAAKGDAGHFSFGVVWSIVALIEFALRSGELWLANRLGSPNP